MFTTNKLAKFQTIALIVMLALGIIGHILGMIDLTSGYVFYIMICIGGAFVTLVAVAQIIVGISEKQAWGIIGGLTALISWTFVVPGIAGLIVGSIFTVIALIINASVAFEGKFIKLPTIKM